MRFFLLLFVVLLAFATALPALDLIVSGWFYDAPAGGFWLRDDVTLQALHIGVQWASRTAAFGMVIAAFIIKPRKQIIFLLLTLIIGPGLLTNAVLKDHWGRARPVQVEEFGGTAHFTPALQPSDQCDRNCSFVAGDPSIGFWLHSLFYIAPPLRRRRAFAWGFFGCGGLLGVMRIVMGGHFLSDVLCAGLLMLASSAIIHRLMFGKEATRQAWRDVL